VTCLLAAAVLARSDRKLQFNKDGKIKIVQLTDMHYGEGDESEQKNDDMVAAVLGFEKPDFVVNTGDVISGYMWDGQEPNWA